MDTPKNAEQLIRGIDFPLLKEQKKALLKLVEDIDNVPLLEKLEGVINLINEVQDLAVDQLGFDENQVFDLHDDIDEFDKQNEKDGQVCTNGLKVSPLYFEIVSQGYNKDLGREEIQVHGGENANIFLIKTDEGFIVDVYGQNDLIDTLAIFEDVLTADAEGVEESGAPENFSDLEVKEYLENWGQKQGEITSNLGYPKSHAKSDELLMEDYFFLEGRKEWYPKISRMYSKREQAIADYVRNDRDKY
jgi:hypothetical protein